MKQLSTTIVDKFTSITPENLQMSRVIMKVVREATGEQGDPSTDLSCDECERTVVIKTIFRSLLCTQFSYADNQLTRLPYYFNL